MTSFSMIPSISNTQKTNFPLFFQHTNQTKFRSTHKPYCRSSSTKTSSFRSSPLTSSTRTLLPPINAGAGGDEERRALETVLNLYSAIKNQNIRQLSDIIGDECRCVCNFVSCFQPFQGKKQVLDFFIYLITLLGNNVELVVKPTIHDGMNIGVEWKLEWNKTHVPLGKGFSFHVCQIYQGKVSIRNVEMFIEPLVHIEPYRIKMMGYTMNIVEKINSFVITSRTGTKRVACVLLLVMIFVVVILFIKKPRLY